VTESQPDWLAAGACFPEGDIVRQGIEEGGLVRNTALLGEGCKGDCVSCTLCL